MIPKLKECGVVFLEQPLLPDDLDGLAEVRRVAAKHHLPVVVDESCLIAADIPRLAGRADGINIKLAKCGALREARRMIATAAAPDDEPAISPALLELGRWMSDYYGAPLGLALRAILPGPLWSVARPKGPAPLEERLLVLTGNGMESLLERERRFKRAPKRR